MSVFALSPDPLLFPQPHLAEPDGLLAVGGDLTPQRLVAAYHHGIFPWYNEGSPILWWSPSPRCVLLPQNLHVPRSLERTLRRGTFQLTFDHDFAGVIRQCAAMREASGTWLLPEMQEAYTALHGLGFAHSVEAWHQGRLAGGLYGVSLGRAFFGESMFYHVPEASKACVVFLARALAGAGFTLLDCQQTTAHMVRFGAQEMPRKHFLHHLTQALEAPTLRQSWKDGIPHEHA